MLDDKQRKDEVSGAEAALTGTGEQLWNIKGHVTRPAAQMPVIYDVGVAVVGGGVSGVIAGVAAARQGVRTVVIESYSYLGGNMGPGIFGGGSMPIAAKAPPPPPPPPSSHAQGHLRHTRRVQLARR